MESEIHLFVIWAEALPFTTYIIDQLNNYFVILEVLETFCSQTRSIKIQSDLYGFTQQESKKRCEEHNYSHFISIIVRVIYPEYIVAKTRWGIAKVEGNMYTQKNNIRNYLGLPFGIHGTLDEKEAKHDFPILTDYDVGEFFAYRKWNKTIKHILWEEMP